MKKAVVLAAGRGKRMGSLTDEVPKPMLPIGNRPMLQHVLQRLYQGGVEETVLVVGYRRELIEKHFREPLPGLPKLHFVVQKQANGTGTAALLTRPLIEPDDFLLTYGDIIADPSEYRGMADKLEADPQASAVIGAKWVDDPHQGAAVYEENGVLTRIIEKPPIGTSTTHWNSAGLYAFRPILFQYLEKLQPSPRGEYELTSAIADLMAQGERALLHAVQGDWRDVGRPEDLPVADTLVGTRTETLDKPE